MIDRKIDILIIRCLSGEIMDIEETWMEITEWLAKERVISLPKGNDFRALYKTENDVIEVIPTETGIPRQVSKKEWEKFGLKFNKVRENGYDPLKPGHYAQVTYNSSYLVAILKESSKLG